MSMCIYLSLCTSLYVCVSTDLYVFHSMCIFLSLYISLSQCVSVSLIESKSVHASIPYAICFKTNDYVINSSFCLC